VNENGCFRSVRDWSVWAVLIQYIDECPLFSLEARACAHEHVGQSTIGR
jgi:hypothetical protein